MEEQLKSNWYMFLLKGIIMILLSLMIFSDPEDALVAYSVYIGIGLMLAGVFIIFSGFSSKKINSNWGWLVLGGFLDLFLGYVVLANPLITSEILPFIFGFWAVIYGVFLIINSSSGGSGWIAVLAGLLLMVIGYIIMFHPVYGGLTIAVWVGILLMISGIYNVIFSFKIK
jgi:uncharacterized membrane protein HdeD (DUF308 family)